ncbi:hypothetical protein, partial [Nocardia vinacea]|uniref:hypothetical protein n=1 Tax=Nocardia vinacea TaxID=96468 RepID=UPI001C3F2AC8
NYEPNNAKPQRIVAYVRRGCQREFWECPGDFREQLDASSTSNATATAKVREFPEFFRSSRDSVAQRGNAMNANIRRQDRGAAGQRDLKKERMTKE